MSKEERENLTWLIDKAALKMKHSKNLTKKAPYYIEAMRMIEEKVATGSSKFGHSSVAVDIGFHYFGNASIIFVPRRDTLLRIIINEKDFNGPNDHLIFDGYEDELGELVVEMKAVLLQQRSDIEYLRNLSNHIVSVLDSK